jgi:hypothetical protein
MTVGEFPKISRNQIERGKLIEAGFIELRASMEKNVTEMQVREARMVFFAGALHLFGTIMSVHEPDAETTAKDMEHMLLKDMERISLVDKELSEWVALKPWRMRS